MQTKIEVNAANFDGNTVLHLAVVLGGPVSGGKMVELLMKHKVIITNTGINR